MNKKTKTRDYHAKLVIYNLSNNEKEMPLKEIKRLKKWLEGVIRDIDNIHLQEYAKVATWRLMKKETNMNNEEEKLDCPKCHSTQHSAKNCITREEFKGTNEEFNKLYKVQPQISNEWEDSYPLNTFTGETKAELISLISQVESKAIERTKGEIIKIIGEKIVQPEGTFFIMNPVEEFIWHENNGRNSEKTRILQALSSNKK